MVTAINLGHTAVFFFSFFTTGLAIECFQCNSVEHPGCSELKVNDTNNQYYKKCDGNYQEHQPFCRKITTEIAHVDDSLRIYRSCGWIDTGNASGSRDFCRKADTDFIKKTHCQCSSSACNASEKIIPSLAWVLMAVTSLTVLREIFRR